jgi:serine/threonine-protein kinase haspin
MPPKQVYGKRTAAKTTTTFAKFISPDKDVVLVSRAKNSTKPAIDEIESVEEELANLALNDDEEDQGEGIDGEGAQEVAKKKRGRPRKGDQSVKKESANIYNTVEQEHEAINLAGELDALTLHDKKEAAQEKEKPTLNAFEPIMEIPVTKKDETNVTPQRQTNDHQKHGERQSTLSTPFTPVRGRKLKAVLIPKRPSSPAMVHLPTPELTPDATPEPDDIYTKYASSLLLQSYGQKIISFQDWSSALDPHFEVSKIAEASYSEVYRLSATSPKSESSNESVLKLVALKTPPDAPLPSQTQGRKARDPARQAKNDLKAREEQDQWKSDINDVHSEVKLLQNLNHIPGFTNFREVTILQGRPTTTFVNAWKAWNKGRPKGKKSEFPDPSKKASYEDGQLWAVIEMQDAGTDCEKVMEAGGMSTVWEVWDVFWGVCLSVAKAEEACKFEHRDLHLENICIRSSRSRTENDLIRPIIQDPLRRKLGFTGLDTTVIDYTLSRADVSPVGPPSSRSSLSHPQSAPSSPFSTPGGPSRSGHEVAYLDLNKDQSLFNGDATNEYQYEIYRYMRGAVLYNDPLKNSPPPPPALAPSHDSNAQLRRSPRKTPQHTKFDDDGNAETTTARHSPPQKPTTALPHSDPSPPPSDIWKSFHPKTNLVWAHFILFKLLQHLQGGEPASLSPKQVMRNVEARPDETAKVVKKASRLYKVLERVGQMLEPGGLKEEGSLGSVKELVVLAMEERWLRVEDVAGS